MPTALQRELVDTFAVLLAARERLTEFEYVAYVAIVVERVLNESGRLGFGEAIHAVRSAE